MTAEANVPAPDTRKALQEALADMSSVDLSWLDPRQTRWSLSRETLRLLDGLVRRLQPEIILDFGSGLSTACMQRACRESHLSCRIVAIDHDPVYLNTAKQECEELTPPVVEFHLAPLVARAPCEEYLPMYHLWPELLDACRNTDLVLIDGPPEALGGREGVLYQVMDVARPGTLVLLDDVCRASERRALHRWQDNFGDTVQIELLEGFPRGLAAITIAEPVPAARLWGHRLRLSAGELARLGRPEDAIALVDEQQWGLTSEDIEHPLLSMTQVAGSEQGPPADEAIAIHRLKDVCRDGARFVAFGKPAFWWLTAYPGLREVLETRCRCVLRNERLVVYELGDLQV